MFIYITGNIGIGTNNPVQRLTVNGNTQMNGVLNLIEQTGTISAPNVGSVVLDHDSNGGLSSIAFRSKVNRGSDYGYIQYQDASVINGGGESARLIIRIQNDADDHICLMPSGNVGIGIINPRQTLEVGGHAVINGEVVATNVKIANAFCLFGTGRMHQCNLYWANRLWSFGMNRSGFYSK